MKNIIVENNLINNIFEISLIAGKQILDIRKKLNYINYKLDNTPVTEADILANKIILPKLEEIEKNIKIISEENTKNQKIAYNETFWLVDPLDGTKEFVNGSNEFTVNIALIKNNSPVIGVVHAPALKKTYYTGSDGKAYQKNTNAPPVQIKTRNYKHKNTNPLVLVSNSHKGQQTDSYLKLHNLTNTKPVGSSLKFCLIAAGEADIYPRFGRTMEWDTAAGHAIVLAAGGSVQEINKKPLMYGKKNFINPDFLCCG